MDHWISRVVIVASVAGALGTLFLRLDGWLTVVLDFSLRGYLMFAGAVMAHEGVHGHLGRTKAANFWWARVALVPALVPYTNFRKTHRMHHAHTNDPALDPDLFARPRRPWEVPFRALGMPHHWYFWLRARGQLRRVDLIDLVANYAGLLAVHGTLLVLVGPFRYATGVLPALVIVSVLLWYPFAIKTHEGWSRGAPETRSHNYHGPFLYWFSLGLSVHRAHHLDQKLSWRSLRAHVSAAPGRRGLLPSPMRDIRAG
ncbi:MAG: fatty acid desaturase [Pseudomonadota bacterium]